MKPELFVSIAALIVAVASAIATFRISRRQTDAQERVLALESRRERDRLTEQSSAQMRAAIAQTGQYNWELRIGNEGRAVARAVSAFIDDQPVGQSPRVIGAERPVTVLGPGATIGYTLLTYAGVDPVLHVRIEWQDASGVPGQWESQLTIT